MEDKKPIGMAMHYTLKLFHEYVDSKMQTLGISRTGLLILGYLDQNSDKDISQKNLCEYLSFKASTISVAIKSLEDDNYIIRKRDEKDSRNIHLSLTDKGLEKARKAKSFFKDGDKLMLNSLSNEEIDEFYLLLDKMNKAIKEGK